MDKRFLPLLAWCIMLPVCGAWAKDLWSPPDELELQVLPPYCRAKLNNDSAGNELYTRMFGNDWGHMHHYCFALNYINRYYLTTDDNARKFYVNSALGNMQYMFSHTTPGFWLRPEMHTREGKLLASAKRDSEALKDFTTAIQENQAYAPAYEALSDLYQDLGQRAKALSTVEEGLKRAPQNRLLALRYKELSGHDFVPPVTTTPVETPAPKPEVKATSPSVSLNPSPTSGQPADSTEHHPISEPGDRPKIGSPTNPYCRFCP